MAKWDKSVFEKSLPHKICMVNNGDVVYDVSRLLNRITSIALHVV